MTSFMLLRDNLRKFIQSHEIGVTRVGHGLLMLIGLFTIMAAFPYASGINHIWIVIPITVAGAFMPLSAVALVMMFFLLVNLAALSMPLAGLTLILFVLSYLFCGVYQAKRIHLVVGTIVSRLLSIPFMIPMQAALLGSASEVVTVICGSFVSFFIYEVYINVNVLKVGEGQMNMVDFVQEKIISNQIFYVYVLSMVALFLVVYVIRTRNIKHAWILSVLGGSATEFLIMLAGYLFAGSTGRIPMLIVANILTVFLGLATSYLYQDLDYTRVEKVQFEDDDYYYYVTAIPKIRLTEEHVEVKHIHKNEVSEEMTNEEIKEE